MPLMIQGTQEEKEEAWELVHDTFIFGHVGFDMPERNPF